MSSKATKSKAKKGLIEEKLVSSISSLHISAFIARKTNLTVFEALVYYLKDIKGFRYRKISMILGRDERNIWTVYQRAKKKREEFAKNN